MIIEIPDIPTSLNKLLRMHWAARRRIQNRFNLAVMVGTRGVPYDFQGLTSPRKVSLKITFHVAGRGRLPDPDNLIKLLFDSLKNNGVIYDDSDKWLNWGKPKVIRGKENKTVIEIC